MNKVQKPDEFELFSTSASKLVTSQTQKLPEQEQQNVIQLEESKERHLLAFLGYQMEALKLRQRELRFMWYVPWPTVFNKSQKNNRLK